jgi:NAD(P)-dependent dehydrogenase (short-subunit alcohol dehydrogenase family)
VTNDPAPAASPGVVLVTGAGGGLGRAFALGFADRGYAVAVADIDAAGAAETARLVEERGARAWHGRLDVTSVAS